jgi:hypothetical protein
MWGRGKFSDYCRNHNESKMFFVVEDHAKGSAKKVKLL